MTRPRLQLHLSTLFIVSLLAAGLVWLNVKQHPRDVEVDFKFWTRGQARFQLHGLSFGWPWTLVETVPSDERERVENTFDGDISVIRGAMSMSSLISNVVVCLALLAVVTVAIEWLTRRVKRKPTQ